MVIGTQLSTQCGTLSLARLPRVEGVWGTSKKRRPLFSQTAAPPRSRSRSS